MPLLCDYYVFTTNCDPQYQYHTPDLARTCSGLGTFSFLPVTHSFRWRESADWTVRFTVEYLFQLRKNYFWKVKKLSVNMSEDKYKLIYFNYRARAEPIRLIFAAANVPYEDFRLEGDDWDTDKQKYPWGKLPVLEVNGEVLAESSAICRFLARRFNLVGSNDLEAAKCDEYVDAIMDCRTHWRSYYWEANPEKKEELKKNLLNVQVPFYFPKFEKILESSKGDYLLGSNYTWADIHVAHTVSFIDETVKPGLLDDYPRLKKFSETVHNIPNIKAWVEKRPKTIR